MRAFVQMTIAQAAMLRRNVSFWLISIFIAVISMLVFGWLFKPDAQAFDLGIVDEDATQASQTLTQSFASLESVKVSQRSRDDELSKLKNGDRGAVVIIPTGFGAAAQQGSAALDVYYDNSNPIRIGYVTSTVEAVVNDFNQRVLGQAGAVKLQKQAVATERVRFIDFLTPGMVGMTIMFTNLAVGFLMVNWREQGILRRLGVTPLRPGILIASQAASFALVSLAQAAVLLLIAYAVFGVSISGNFLLLGVTCVFGVFCMLSLGYTIASFAGTVTSFSAAQQLLAFPMLFLGRSYFPIDPPAWLNPLVQAIPLTHLNDALREIVNHNGGVGDLWVSWLILAAWAAGGYLLSMRVFRWQ